jgi:hypothetical protein
MDELMSEFLIPIFFAASSIIIGAGLRWALRHRRPLPALIFAVCLLYELVFVDMPMAYSSLTGFSLERQMDEPVAPGELAIVLLGELVYVAGFTAALVGFESMRKSKTTATEVAITPGALSLLTTLGCLGVVIGTATLLSPVPTLAEGSEHMLAKTYAGPADLMFTWLVAGFWCSGIYAGGVLFVAPSVPRMGRIIGAAALLPIGLFGLLSGLRGRVVWVVMSVVIAGVMFRAKRKVKIALWSLIASLPLFSAMGNLDFRYIVQVELGGKSFFEVLPLLTAASKLTMGGGAHQMGDSLISRAMAVRNSVILYRLYDRGDGCGLAAISSSLYLPIPRMLWPLKRPAGSCDDTDNGGAMYKVMSFGYAAPYWVMGPYLASAHAYYEGGWIFVILFGPILGFLWSILCRFAEKKPTGIAIVYIMIFLSAFTLDGFFTGLAPLHVFFKTFWLAFVPLILLDKAVGLLTVCRSRPPRPVVV